MRRFGFTLLEVNLAMFIMAVGVLGLVSLYTLGYRENRQSIEDVRGAAVAQANMSLLVAALSSTNLTWDTWASINEIPSGGWGYYAGGGGEYAQGSSAARAINNPTAKASSDFGSIMQKCGFNASFDDGGGLACGLVVVRRGARCSISMRSGVRPSTLLYEPLYYTEVRFQGLKQ